MAKEKQVADHIYIFVPRKLTLANGTEVDMPHGRAAAQCAHIGAGLANAHAAVFAMTTIILAADNSQHLEKIARAAIVKDDFPYMQWDTFGTDPHLLLQAVAFGPYTKKQGEIFKFVARY